jgi:AmiR/NasT family two-component response regulator
VQNHARTPEQDASIGEAGAIAMERYDLTEPRALALLARLARRHKVDVRVVAAAIIAAALARRRAARAQTER